MSEEIKLETSVKFDNTVLIIGLEGWTNGGKVSTFTVKYLIDKLKAERLGEISSERFHDYFIQRPVVSIKEGIVKSYYSAKTELFYWKNKEGKKDLVLLLGYEPHLDWSRYADSILRLVEITNVNRIYTIGGFIGNTSYETEARISSSTNNENLVAELKKKELELTTYVGPTSVYSEILWKAKKKKIDVVSLWIGIPLFVGEGIYPRGTHDMLKKIIQLTGIELDLNDIKNRVETFEKEIEIQPKELVDNIRRIKSREKTTYIS